MCVHVRKVLNLNERLVCPSNHRFLGHEFFGVKTLDGFGIGSSPTTFPAAWSIIDYLKQTQKTLPKQLCSIHLLQTSQRMQMDYATSRNLELVQSLQDASLGYAPSLFDLLNYTKTSMGARLLKERIKSPFSTLSDIQKHQLLV